MFKKKFLSVLMSCMMVVSLPPSAIAPQQTKAASTWRSVLYPEETAREALRLATHKLPCKCKIVSRADLEGGDNSEN